MSRRLHLQFLLIAALVVFPLVPGTSDLLGGIAQAAVFTIIASSLVMLTGWVGQISLAHAAFVGIGAYASGWASSALGLPFPLSLPIAACVAGLVAAGLGIVALRVRGLYLAVATLIFSWAASEFLFRQSWVLDYSSVPSQTIGLEGSLLYVDMSSRFTYYYVAWGLAIAVVFGLLNLRDSKTGRAFYSIRGSEMAAASLGMDVLRYKTLAFGLSGAIAGIAGNLIMTHARVVTADAFDFTQSLFFLAIAVVGGLNSLAGAVAAAFAFAAMSELFFRVILLNEFLQLTSAVLLALIFRVYPGGLAALGNALMRRGGRMRHHVRTLPSRFERVVLAAGRPSGTGEADEEDALVEPAETQPGWVARSRAATLAAFAAVIVGAQRTIVRIGGIRGSRRTASADLLQFTLDDEGRPGPADVNATLQRVSSNGSGDADAGSDGHRSLLAGLVQRAATVSYDASRRSDRASLIEAEHITVRFGGLTAVDDASLTVREGEITALIGPNGAGKTTLFNAIAGFNVPTEGRVRLYGHDVTNLPVHRRAQRGIARTFQLIQLFPELTVFDNLLAATHLQNATGFVQHAAVSPTAMYAEAAARARVRTVVEMLDLHEEAARPVAGLPFGILRMVEVARSLVMGARVVMLDEPASGLDERETDQLMDVLRVARSLGATLLLIEHDVRMVTAVSDYIYVLERGAMIAEGTPDQIQRDPEVIAAYLGASTDDEAGSADETIELPALGDPPVSRAGAAVGSLAGQTPADVPREAP